jgi:hypothetical protein
MQCIGRLEDMSFHLSDFPNGKKYGSVHDSWPGKRLDVRFLDF